MGLFDRFKKKKEETPVEDLNINEPETEDSYLSRLSRTSIMRREELTESKEEEYTLVNGEQTIVTTTKETLEIVNEKANDDELPKELSVKEEFENKYRDLIAFKDALALQESIGFRSKSAPESLDKYERFLEEVASDPEALRKYLFFPLFLEKNEYNIISDLEKKELAEQIEGVGEKSSMTYFRTMLSLYQTIGVISIDDDYCFEKSFKEYYGLSDSEIETIKNRIKEETKEYSSYIGIEL